MEKQIINFQQQLQSCIGFSNMFKALEEYCETNNIQYTQIQDELIFDFADSEKIETFYKNYKF